MFIGNDNVTSGGNVVDIQAESAGFMDPVEEALHNIAVDEANYNQILGCLAVAEVTAAHQGLDPTSVYTESTISDFWGKIKEFFKKIWAKIKGLWAKLVATFDQHFKSGQDFFNKYKKTLADKFTKIDKDKIKFSGYKFTFDWIKDIDESKFDITQVANAVASSDDDALTDLEENFRGYILGESGSYTAKEFTKELHDKLRDGGAKDEDLSGIDFSYISKVLADSTKRIDKVKKNTNKIEKAIQKDIQTAEKNQSSNINAAAKDPDDKSKSHAVEVASKAIRLIKSYLAVYQIHTSSVVTAYKDEISQAKGFAAQVLRAGVRDGFKEGAGVGSSTSGNSVFGSVKLA